MMHLALLPWRLASRATLFCLLVLILLCSVPVAPQAAGPSMVITWGTPMSVLGASDPRRLLVLDETTRGAQPFLDFASISGDSSVFALSNGSVYIASVDLFANGGLPSNPEDLSAVAFPTLKPVSIEGLPGPAGSNWTASSLPPPSSASEATFPTLRAFRMSVMDSMWMFDDYSLYRVPYGTPVPFGTDPGPEMEWYDCMLFKNASCVSATQVTLSAYAIDQRQLEMDSPEEPFTLEDAQQFVRLEAVPGTFSTTHYAITASGHLYLFSGKSTMLGVADPYTNLPQANVSMPIPRLSSASLSDPLRSPVAISEDLGVAFANRSLYYWGNMGGLLIPSPIAADLSSIIPNASTAGINVWHLQKSLSNAFLVILADGTCFSFASLPLVPFTLETALTAFIQSSPVGNASYITQIIAGTSTYDFRLLTNDGKLWQYTTTGDLSLRLTYPLSMLASYNPTQAGPWLENEFDGALPSEGWGLTEIRSYSTRYIAIARPLSPQSSSATVEPMPRQPPSNTHDIIVWDGAIKGDSDPTATSIWSWWYRPTAELNTYSQVLKSNWMLCVLTTNGTLMMSRQGAYQALLGVTPLYRELPAGAPRIISQEPFQGRSISKLACAKDTAIVVLNDGTLAAWGENLFAATTPQPPPTQEKKRATRSVTEEHQLPSAGDYVSTLFFLNPVAPSAKFVDVKASQSLSSMIAVDEEGRLFSIAFTNVVSPDMVFHAHLWTVYGAVRNFSFSDNDNALWMVAGNSTGTVRLIKAVVTSNCNTLEDCITYTPASAPDFDMSGVKQVVGGSGFVIVLHETGLFGFGSHSYLFKQSGANGTYTTLQSLSIDNPIAVSEIKKIAVYATTLYIVTHSGNVHFTCSEMANYVSMCLPGSKLWQIMPQYHILDLPFDYAPPTASSALTFLHVSGPQKPLEAYRNMSTPYLNLVLGSTDLMMAQSAMSMDGTRKSLRLLRDGHPLDTDRISNIKMGSHMTFDMRVDHINGTGSSSIPFMQSGPTLLISPQFVAPAPLDDPAARGETSSQRTGIVYRNVPLVDRFSVNQWLAEIYADCRITWPTITQTPFSSISPDYPISMKPAAKTIAYDWNWNGRGLNSTVPAFVNTDLSIIYAMNPAYNNTLCVNYAEGEVVTRAWCEETCDSLPQPRLPLLCHYCLLETSASGNNLFARGYWSTQAYAANCTTGMYGEENECNLRTTLPSGSPTAAASALAATDIQVIGTPLDGARIADASIAKRHVLVLTRSGKVVAWGQNARGQLGTPAWSTPVSHLPIEVDLTSVLPSGASQIVAAGRSSFAVSLDNTSIASWGCNLFGQLGRLSINPSGKDSEAFDWKPGRVQLPSRVISSFKCTSYSCYVLYGDDGSVWSWGFAANNQLGRQAGTSMGTFDPIPAIATNLVLPLNRVITEIHTAQGKSHLLLRALLSPSSPSSNPVPQSGPIASPCVGQAPSSEFVCEGGVWVTRGNITIGTPYVPGSPSSNVPAPRTTFPISGPTVVIGSVTVTSGGTIVFSPPSVVLSTSGPLLNVSGCLKFENGTSVEIVLDFKTWSETKGKLNEKSSLLIESSCQMLTVPVTITVSTPKDCRKTTARLSSVQLQTGRYGMQSTFYVDAKACSVWWIILVSVLAVVFLAVVIIVIVWKVVTNRRMKDGRAKLRGGS